MGDAAVNPKAMWIRFGAALATSLVAMYFLAFSEIDIPSHFHFSLSTFWITVMMTSAMGVIMIIAMWPMFGEGRLKIGLLAGFGVLLLVAFGMGRIQAGIGDEAFLRSMIPHHSRAVLVCQEADLDDPGVIKLCDGIIESQNSEIRQMEQMLATGVK